MKSLKTAKTLGGIGSILIFLGIIPYFSEMLNIIGGILFFIAMYKIGKDLEDSSIFKKFFTGFFIEISGMFFAVIIVLIFFPRIFEFKSYIALIIGLLIIYPFIIIGSNFYRKSFALITYHTNNKFFKLAGNFMFWGAIGIIILGLGLIAIYVGWFILIKAFFSLPDAIPEETRTAYAE
jgi:uncharacterized membrane protein